ncbi:MAG: Glutamine amidotransferase, class I [uncultured Acidimicrobiales bacterium]|uniref:Glutamine amidotransferase, class I n=1 Tax=uncultured Acidimicrobiales bacterium TaxID=310071 RepID=A0A6J4J887_9ACTN|nr:MAG: Glutamine amidotransferase, class I [uncultured Acidimicrobiales bacterium]
MYRAAMGAPRIGLTSSPGVFEDRLVATLERAYTAAIVQAGCIPLYLPMLDPIQAEAVVSVLDGLLFTGGGDVDPTWYGRQPSPHLGPVNGEQDGWEMALVRAGLSHELPMLGICRGSQVMNVALGGTLVQHLPDTTTLEHCVKERCSSPVHDVVVDGRSRLGAVLGVESLGVNSLHHQAVEQLGDGLYPVAWAEDGTVEAVESSGPNRMIGVQWHPELLVDDARHAALFSWLAAEAGQPVSSTVPSAVPSTAAA